MAIQPQFLQLQHPVVFRVLQHIQLTALHKRNADFLGRVKRRAVWRGMAALRIAAQNPQHRRGLVSIHHHAAGIVRLFDDAVGASRGAAPEIGKQSGIRAVIQYAVSLGGLFFAKQKIRAARHARPAVQHLLQLRFVQAARPQCQH